MANAKTQEATVTLWIERVADLPDPGLKAGLVLIVTKSMRYGFCKLRPISDFSEVEEKGLTGIDLAIESVGLCMGSHSYSYPDNDPRVLADVRALKVLEVDGKRALIEVLRYRPGARFTPGLQLDRLEMSR